MLDANLTIPDSLDRFSVPCLITSKDDKLNEKGPTMKDDRLLVPIDAPYLHAVGLAMICFARLEWDAVWCCEKMEPGYVNTVSRKTAGTIAADLVKCTAKHVDPAKFPGMGEAAAEFKRLTGRRNDLVHANPGRAPGDAQRLFRHGSEWTIAMVDDLADEFAAAATPLNAFHHAS